MIIEDVCLSDVKELAEMESKYIYHPYSEAVLSEMLVNHDCLALKAVEDGIITGYISGQFVIDEFDINNVVVKEEYRRKGYAAALMSEVVLRCKKKNVQKMYLEVSQSNEAAKALYHKFDFKYSYERKKYYGNESALVYIKSM